MSKPQFSSPNAVTWEYFHIVEVSLDRARGQTADRLKRQDIALAIVMALNAIEVFMNVYFRVLVEEPKHALHKGYFLKCVGAPMSLHSKLTKWPKRILGADLSQNSLLAQNVLELKDLRNSIVHFATTHESVRIEGTNIVFHGLANTSRYFSLELEDAEKALDTARELVRFIMLANGIEVGALGGMLHAWCGYVH